MKYRILILILLASSCSNLFDSEYGNPFSENDFIGIHKNYGYNNISLPIPHEPRRSNQVIYELKKDAIIVSIGDGKVIRIEEKKRGFGNSILIEHSNDLTARYSHLGNTFIHEEGYLIKKGEPIGMAGNSGTTTIKNGVGIAIYENDKAVNPSNISSSIE